jgi:hypothetical protein
VIGKPARTFSESDHFSRGKERDCDGNTNNKVKMLYEMIGVVSRHLRRDGQG